MKPLSKIEGKRILTFILAGGRGSRLSPLTKIRSKPSVPFGGNHRVIDFVLSSCINSRLRNIFLLTQTKSQSLDTHIRMGWNFLSMALGEFILPIPAQQQVGERWYLGSADALFQNLNIIEDYRPDLILVLSGDHIYRMDFKEMVMHHLETGADLTLPVLPIHKTEAHAFGVLSMGADGRVTRFLEKPKKVEDIPDPGDTCHINMGIYLFDTESLVRHIIHDIKQDSAHDFGQNIIPAMVAQNRVFAMPFENNRLGDYWRDIGTLDNYYQSNMDMLDGPASHMLSDKDWPIYPVGRAQHPTRFRKATIENSRIAGGCDLDGCSIINSVVFPGVTIGAGSVVENSILFPEIRIGKNVHIRKAIVDKHVWLQDGAQVGLNPAEDQSRFTITESGITACPKGYVE
ncbi:MAG: sugar phosphate nucleotidyltransferase [Deltaproteobacteria bacterium]|nr:sugar phosphate nucleotidyltransferase [Deltaproteobacteria bacterium]